MRILFLGDIFGKPGRILACEQLPHLIANHHIDFCIVNGENLADGKGLTEKTVKPLFSAGVDAITGGNHLWDRAESLDYISSEKCIVRPLNYSPHAPGNCILTLEKGEMQLTVCCMLGQVFMPPCDSPFTIFERDIEAIRSMTNNIIVDFHAESTAEKRAFAYYAVGKVSAVIGTHTHIQTADEEILEGYTAYITDIGMTGAHDSVIGIKKEIIIQKFTTGIPQRFEVSSCGMQINGVVIDIDQQTGQALSIQRIRELYQD